MADGVLPANEKFSDIEELSAYIHSLGLKFGIYSFPGPTTCGSYWGSYRFERLDAKNVG